MKKVLNSTLSAPVNKAIAATEEYARRTGRPTVTCYMFLFVAAKMSLISCISEEEGTAIAAEAGLVPDMPLESVIDTVSAVAMGSSRKARIEHVIGAIIASCGVPRSVSANLRQGLEAYITSWDRLCDTHSAKETPQEFRILNGCCTPIHALPLDRFIYARPELENEVMTGMFFKLIVLVGEPGVGKRTIIDKLVSDKSLDKLVVRLDQTRVQRGCRLRGDFEDRMYELVGDILRADATLVIPNFTYVEEAGIAPSNSFPSLSAILCHAAQMSARIIMTMSERRWQHLKEAYLPIRNHVHVIKVEPLDEEASTSIVAHNLCRQYKTEDIPKTYMPVAGKIVRLAKRYLPAEAMPGAALRLASESVIRSSQKQRIITTDDVTDSVAKLTNIPTGKIDEDEMKVLANLSEKLKARVMNQDEAVNAVTASVKRNRAGFGEPHRPSGSFIFLGPTGVGKTELAKALADTIFGGTMVRIDMSEYSEQHSVSKLIGSPPGYIGYNEGGRLVNELRKNPYCIVLFDEIEKAHPNVWNVLLQIFEEGCLTDGRGNKADCTHAIFIMTSNTGSRNFEKEERIGFKQEHEDSEKRTKNIKDKVQKALKKNFPPEFINRLDGVIIFNALHKDVFTGIASKMLNDLEIRIKDTVKLHWKPGVEKLLAEKGFSEEYGAREMRRVLRSGIEDPLVDFVLKKAPKSVMIAAKNQEFVFKELLNG